MKYNVKFAKPEEPVHNSAGTILGFTVQQKNEETIINVIGEIGSVWDGLTATDLVPIIQNASGPIRMKLNTPGGGVFDALTIIDALMDHPHTVTADIVGQAWSAGTILTSAADLVRIAPMARFGIHNAWSGSVIMGNSQEIRDQMRDLESHCQMLDKLNVQIAEFMAERSGQDVEQVIAWMKGGEDGVDGTEWVGAEVVELGFADELISRKADSVQDTDDRRTEFQAACRVREMQLIEASL